MRKFMVERGAPGIGSAELWELDAVAAIDNKIISQLWPDSQWLTSFIADDKTCFASIWRRTRRPCAGIPSWPDFRRTRTWN